MVPLFDFLRKKGKVKIDIPTYSTEVNGNKLKNADDMNVTGDAGSSESSLTAQANINENSREITIPDAVALLRSQGEIKVKDLVEGLMPIKLSVEKLLKNETFQEDAQIKEKYHRATVSQVQLCSYFTGLTDILALREAYKNKMGSKYNLKEFHEQFLSHGSAPVTYIREVMLK